MNLNGKHSKYSKAILFKIILTKNMQEIMSEDILAWGGSSSLADGFKLWFKQDSSKPTRASACCSIEPVSLKVIEKNI